MATLLSPAKLAANAVGMITAIVTDLQALNGSGFETATLDKNLAPGAVPGSYTGTLIQLVSRLSNRFLAAVGIADWNTTIPTTLAAAAAHYTASGSHGIYYGSGSPEGVVTAPIGALYRDTTNGTIYFKASGAAAVGWRGIGTMLVPNTISPLSVESLGTQLAVFAQVTTQGNNAYPTANKAVYIPFKLEAPATVKKLFWHNGAGVSGNACVAIYDAAFARLVTTGSVAMAGTTAMQIVDVADVALATGLYYLGFSCDNNTAQPVDITVGTSNGMSGVGAQRGWGIMQQSSAFPLPTTMAGVAPTDASVPMCGVQFGNMA